MRSLRKTYRFDKYRTREKPEKKPSLKTLDILTRDPGGAKRAFAPLESVAEGVFLTRDLVSEPANIIYPETLEAMTQSKSPQITISAFSIQRPSSARQN